jgi:hypothetical protein
MATKIHLLLVSIQYFVVHNNQEKEVCTTIFDHLDKISKISDTNNSFKLYYCNTIT